MMQSARAKPLIGTSDDLVPIARWLFAVAALVIAIVVVGGITRLTESGLSITVWQPISGAIPPLTHAQWQTEFEHYRQIDQYAAVHAGMTLGEFKHIFFWEYLHRLLGRVIGMVMILGTAWFWMRRTIPAGYKPRLLALIALIGLQGTFGWLMVSSGLKPGMTEVAPGWLATHLLTALFTMGGLIWTALDVLRLRQGEPAVRMARFSALVLAMLAVQLCLGAFVAGLRAGYVAGAGWFSWDAWPLMQGRLFPDGVDWSSGLLHALTKDQYLVHFLHRWWAFAVLAALVVMGRRLRAMGRRDVSVALHIAVGTQILLGIATVWSGVFIDLAVTHQLVGALLVAASVWAAHTLSANGSSAR